MSLHKEDPHNIILKTETNEIGIFENLGTGLTDQSDSASHKSLGTYL